MIADPETYFRQFVPERENLLKQMEAEAAKEQIPIIGPMTAQLLYILARASGAKSVLELGTATGYSGVYLARAAVENGGRLSTVEWDPDMARAARENFEKAGVSAAVDIHVGDACEILEKLEGPFDFAFMDIDKEFYARTAPTLRDRMKAGGLLVVDNVGFADSVPFNRIIAESARWRCVHMYSFLPGHSPEHDGLCFALAI